MLDKISKKVIAYLMSCEDYTFYPRKGFPDDIPQDEFLSSVDYLESQGYVSVCRVSRGAVVSVTLLHKGKHSKEFNSLAFKRYLADKWADILALIISVAAFYGAYRHEINAAIQTLKQVLPG